MVSKNLLSALKKISLGREKISTGGYLIIIILLGVFFEGAAGKWVNPQLGQVAVLFRDFLCILFVCIAFNKARFQCYFPGLVKVFFVLSGALLFWGAVQSFVNQTPIYIYILGLRFWLLYQWVAILAASTLKNNELIAVARVAVMLLVAATPLAVMQHLLPPGSFLNSQVDTDEDSIFTVTSGIVRTTGTFSFTTGYALFISFCIPLVLTNSLFGRQIFNSRYFKNISLVALLVSSLVSGSRTAVISLGLFLGIYLIVELFWHKKIQKKIFSPLLFSIFSVVLLPFIFPDVIPSLLDRFSSAGESENILERLFSTVFGESSLLDSYSAFGYTIGSSSNVASYFMTGSRDFLFGETESSRVLSEAGIFGFIWIIFKLVFFFWGCLSKYRINFERKNSGYITYWSVCLVALMTWPVIGQLSINAIAGFVVMFSLSSLRLTIDN
ncbi:MAG: hypothetical protein H7325_01040 [Pedobacter sp.]|nr:hypothetical protein [Pedobacter sp.]